MRRSMTHIKAAAILLAGLLLLVACDLGASENAPPTLAPRPTFTPPATLGFAPVRPIAELIVTPATPEVDEISRLLQQVESDRLMAHIRSLQDVRTRHIASNQFGTELGIGAARQYIRDQLEMIRAASNDNLYIFEDQFLAYLTAETSSAQRNIVGAISGSELNAGTIVVGAHYDSIGSPREDGATYAPGANDNGSGVAALLELARIMSAAQYKAAVMFVFFSAEEFNRQGSISFANWLKQRDVDVLAMLNLDTIGNIHDFNGRSEASYLRVYSAGPNDTSPSRKLARTSDFLRYNYALDMGLQVQDAIDREGRYGDHFSFSDLGYPAIRFINAYEEKVNGDPTDTIEFIESDYLRRATQLSLALVASLADGPRPPRNIVLRASEDGKRELVWEEIEDAASYIIALRPPGGLVYQQFPIDRNKVEWEGFSEYAGIAIAAQDRRGLIGPLSAEIIPG